MMNYALTGQPPFSSASAFEIMMAHARDPVVSTSQLHPGVPTDLERVVLICLTKKPDERYRDVETLGAALASCSSASEWDGEKADDWWADKVQIVPIDAPAQPAGVES